MRKLALPSVPPNVKKYCYQGLAVVLALALAGIVAATVYSLAKPFFD